MLVVSHQGKIMKYNVRRFYVVDYYVEAETVEEALELVQEFGSEPTIKSGRLEETIESYELDEEIILIE